MRDQLSGYRQSGIIFGAISGIDLDPRGGHPGPHVGSFHNMRLKRAILASGAPVVLFLDQDKLPYPYIPDRCFSVSDSEFSWEHVCADVPLALARAFDDESRADQQQPSRPKDRPWCIVAANKRFVEKREGWKPSL